MTDVGGQGALSADDAEMEDFNAEEPLRNILAKSIPSTKNSKVQLIEVAKTKQNKTKQKPTKQEQRKKNLVYFRNGEKFHEH